jgi:hypothetical protein
MHGSPVRGEGRKKSTPKISTVPMSAWTLSLMVVVTLIWAAMLGAVAYLAAQKVSARADAP